MSTLPPHCPYTFEPQRPRFHHQNTQDRLREAARQPMAAASNIKKDRKSVFKEVGLESADYSIGAAGQEQGLQASAEGAQRSPRLGPGSTTDTDHARKGHKEFKDAPNAAENLAKRKTDSLESSPQQTISPPPSDGPTSPPQSPNSNKTPWYAKLATGRRPRIRSGSSAPTAPMQNISTMTMLVVLVAVMAPLFGPSGKDPAAIAEAGPIVIRADSPTDVCARWAQQVAVVNGTLYLYGGESKTTVDQENNTWNNDFLTIDLTSSWDVSSPSLTGLPQPSGPPAVSLGYLWNDYKSVYLYGGEFADNPYVEPAAVSVWQYDISSSSWNEYSNLETSAGNNSDGGGVALQRAAEGAGISVPELGLSWYFGGHLDLATTPGWSDQTARVYLKSLLEFTHPGYSNDAVTSLQNSGAPASGAYRNITQGGLQTSQGFGERADGVLVFVPGWGVSGVLIGLAGGTASEFTDDMSTLDVYDIATSTWYHQSTTGTAPGVRVNPCAVVASAPDASSFQIYLFGGQNLQPAGDQIQYDDLYILTIPAFEWIGPITQSGDSIPSARAGHTCNLRDGQMVLVGGFNTSVTTCDSPGVYVFNASSLQWSSSFTALSDSPSLDPGNSVLSNSYGYTVPDEVVSVIGGNPSGSATVTAPVSSATGGPFATGVAPVFTITASGSGPTATITSPAAQSGGVNGSGISGGLIAAIVVAVLACIAAGYLGYCAWLYRRQVRAYKTHLAVQNRFPARSASHGSFGRMLAFGRSNTNRGEKKRPSWWRANNAATAAAAAAGAGAGISEKRDDTTTSSSNGGESFAWVGRNPLPTTSSGTTSTAQRPSPLGPPSTGEDKPSPASGNRRSSQSSTTSSTELLLEGQEPSFFSVVLGPRRALRVVNGLEGEGEGERNT